MSLPFRLAENTKIEELLNPAADAAGRTGNWISLKNASGKVFVVCKVAQANAAQVTFTLLKAQDFLGTGSVTFTPSVPIWSNPDTSVATGTDTLVAQPAGTSFQTSTTLKNKIVLFEVDVNLLNNDGPAIPWKTITVQTSPSNAANITSADAYVFGLRFGAGTPPTMNSGTP